MKLHHHNKLSRIQTSLTNSSPCFAKNESMTFMRKIISGTNRHTLTINTLVYHLTWACHLYYHLKHGQRLYTNINKTNPHVIY